MDYNILIFLFPLIGAALGWISNSLFLLLLFHPQHPKKLIGFTFHGVIPKHRAHLTDELAHYAAQSFSFKDFEKKIIAPENFTKLLPLIESHVDDFLRVKLQKQMPFLSTFIGDRTINSLKKAFMEELESLFPQVMLSYAGNLRNEFDLKKMIHDKISMITTEAVEKGFHRSFSRQKTMFKLLGAITGFIIGAVYLVIHLLSA